MKYLITPLISTIIFFLLPPIVAISSSITLTGVDSSTCRYFIIGDDYWIFTNVGVYHLSTVSGLYTTINTDIKTNKLTSNIIEYVNSYAIVYIEVSNNPSKILVFDSNWLSLKTEDFMETRSLSSPLFISENKEIELMHFLYTTDTLALNRMTNDLLYDDVNKIDDGVLNVSCDNINKYEYYCIYIKAGKMFFFNQDHIFGTDSEDDGTEYDKAYMKIVNNNQNTESVFVWVKDDTITWAWYLYRYSPILDIPRYSLNLVHKTPPWNGWESFQEIIFLSTRTCIVLINNKGFILYDFIDNISNVTNINLIENGIHLKLFPVPWITVADNSYKFWIEFETGDRRYTWNIEELYLGFNCKDILVEMKDHENELALDINDIVSNEYESLINTNALFINIETLPSVGRVYGIVNSVEKEITEVDTSDIFNSIKYVPIGEGSITIKYNWIHNFATGWYSTAITECSIIIEVYKSDNMLSEEELQEEEEEKKQEEEEHVLVECHPKKSIWLQDGSCRNILTNLQLYQNKGTFFLTQDVDFSLLDLKDNIENIIKIFSNYINNNINYKDLNIILNLNGESYNYFYWSDGLTESLPSTYSVVDLKECKQKLNLSYNRDSDSDLKISLLNIFYSNKGYIPQLEYEVYSNSTTKLDLSLCKNDPKAHKIQVLYHLSDRLNQVLSESYEFSFNYGIDIFNPNDAFFNDICYPFTSVNHTDVTLQDRRVEYFPNISMCENNCTYIGVNHTTNSSICICEIKEEVEIKDRGDTLSIALQVLPKTNIHIIQCYHLWLNWKIFTRNIGWYVQLILLASVWLLWIIYFTSSIEIIQRSIFDLILRPHPINVIPFKSNIQATPNHNCNSNYLSMNSIMLNNSKENYKILSALNNSYYNNFQDNTIDKKKGDEINNKNAKSCTVLGLSIKENTWISNNNTHLKNKEISVSNKILWNGHSFKLNNQTDFKSTKEEKPSLSTKELKVKRSTQMKFIHKYWILLCLHHSYINLAFNRSNYTRRNIKSAYIWSSISMNIAINAILYSDSYISQNFYTDKTFNDFLFILTNQFFKSWYSFLISVIIHIPWYYLCFGLNSWDKIAKKKEKKFLHAYYVKQYNSAKNKLIIYSVINTFFMVFYLYYTYVFCAVYANSQFSLLLASMISLIMDFIFPFFINFIIVVFDVFSKEHCNDCVRGFVIKMKM